MGAGNMNVVLKVAVLTSGKNQIGLAREIGISDSLLSKIIGGWSVPSTEVRRRIAEALNIPIEELFLEQGTEENGGAIGHEG